MIKITIDIDDANTRASLQRLKAATSDMRLFFADVGESLLMSTRQRASQQTDPDGNPWVALSAAYERRKQQKRPGAPILKFDNHMLGDRLSYQVDENSVQIGTSAVYGATQHFGRGNIPPRPFLGLSTQDKESIIAKANRYLENALNGSA